MSTLTCSGIVRTTSPAEGNHLRSYSSGRCAGSMWIEFQPVPVRSDVVAAPPEERAQTALALALLD
eukprot:7601296-Pyramimonas_sp.AAC.1